MLISLVRTQQNYDKIVQGEKEKVLFLELTKSLKCCVEMSVQSLEKIKLERN